MSVSAWISLAFVTPMTTFLNIVSHGLTQAPWWVAGVVLLVMLQMTIFATTLYLHRSATHRGVDFHPAVSHAFRFWLWLATATVTKQWVAIHRKHHAHCETEHDPHSPHTRGIGTVLGKGAELYQAVKDDQELLDTYGKGTPDDWIERHVYTKRSYMGIVVLLVINVTLFGAVGLAMWAIQMAWIPFWAAGVVNGLGHWWGYRNFDTEDASRNLAPWGVWIGGEELHNNHHAFPSSARFDARSGEFDVGWAAIRVLRALGLARVLRVRTPLIQREAPAEPDQQTMQALLQHRWHIAAEYMRQVVRPHVVEHNITPPRRVWSVLRRNGQFTSARMRARLDAFVAEHPSVQDLLTRRQELLEILEMRAHAKHDALVAWCRAAEDSGHTHLKRFVEQIKSYTVQPTAA